MILYMSGGQNDTFQRYFTCQADTSWIAPGCSNVNCASTEPVEATKVVLITIIIITIIITITRTIIIIIIVIITIVSMMSKTVIWLR